MHSIDEVIRGLECFTTRVNHACVECPFNPVPGWVWTYGCISGQKAAAEEAQRILMELKDAKENDEGNGE